MRLLITIIFVFIGSILVGSTIHQLSGIGNGVLRLTGAALIIGLFILLIKVKTKNSLELPGYFLCN
jgi:hypothetical protein